MFSEDGMRGDASYEEAFIDLIDASEARDVGIVNFEQIMEEEQDSLRSMYVGKRINNYGDGQIIEEKLNEDWRYDGLVATVTGRVYLSDEDLDVTLPDDWGEQFDDDEEWGPYYYLDDAKLYSRGIRIMPSYDEEGTVIDVKVGYAFSLEESNEDMPEFIAYIGELSKHEYDEPTPEEAELRLQRLWPEQFAFADQLMHPDLQSALPRRLQLLGRRLQTELHDEKFREYFELFLNERLALDQALPYVTTIKKQLQCFDGENPDEPNDPGEWVNITVPDKTAFLVYYPEIHIFLDDNDHVHIFLQGSTYNNEKGEEPEYIKAEVAQIGGFRSVRATRSLVGRAILGSLEEIPSDQLEVSTIPEVLDSSNILTLSQENDSEKQNNGGDPEHIRAMEQLEKAFLAAIEYVKGHRRDVYSSQEEAYAAAKSLLDEGVSQNLIEAGIGNNYDYEFQGSGPMRARVAPDLPDVSNNPHVFVYGIDTQRPFNFLQDGDSFYGMFASLQPLVSRVYRDGDEVGYKAVPALFATTELQSHSALNWDGVSIVSIEVHNRAVIPLDGTATIKLRALEVYRAKKAALLEVAREYRNTPTEAYLRHLNAALATEKNDAFSELNHLEYLTGLDASVKQAVSEGKRASAALDTLDAMFVQKTVLLQGALFVKTEGKIEPDTTFEDQKIIQAFVVDVRNDIINDDIVLVVQVAPGETGIRYIPIKSVTTLASSHKE